MYYFSFQIKSNSGTTFIDEDRDPRRRRRRGKRQRMKRYDQIMDRAGCSSHESGLAMAYYAIMLNKIFKNI